MIEDKIVTMTKFKIALDILHSLQFNNFSDTNVENLVKAVTVLMEVERNELED